jgi:hypothetical protein
MAFRQLPNSDVRYGLIGFDAQGQERTDDPDGLMSHRLLQLAAQESFTNIFLFSHGWRGDVPAAIAQYDRWMSAFLDRAPDLQLAKHRFPRFKPLLVGVHWPSEPWGQEELGGAGFGAPGGISAEDLLKSYADRLGDSPAVRQCLSVLVDEARRNAAAEELSDPARDAYVALNEALGLGSGGASAPPDADRVEFDPDEAFAATNEDEASFGGWNLGGILGPLRLLSYWTMKKRARTIGEGGLHTFLKNLQEANAARVHLMGHSFGCIVVSGMVGGPDGHGPLLRPVSSLALVQGAVSLWSYSPQIPLSGAGAGYFSHVLGDGKIAGPLVTTRSKNDDAVGFFYPLASRLRGSAAFAPGSFPEYGAIGAYGIQGLPAKGPIWRC